MSEIPLPAGPMPAVISNALFSTTRPLDGEDPELEEQRAKEYFERMANIPSAWTKPPEGSPPPRLRYIDEDEEERKAYAIPALDKLVHKDATASTETSGRFRFSKQNRSAPDAPLEKGVVPSAREVSLREYILRCVQNGDDDVESLAEWTAERDPERAEEIRRIGQTLNL